VGGDPVLPVGVSSCGGAPLGVPSYGGQIRLRGEQFNARSMGSPRAEHLARPIAPPQSPELRHQGAHRTILDAGQDRAWETSTQTSASEVSPAWACGTAAGKAATGGSGHPEDNRKRLNDLFPASGLSAATTADVSRFGFGDPVCNDRMNGRRKGSLDLKDPDALAQLVTAQQSPRTVAEKAKARREIKEELSWDTNVRTTSARASYQDPRSPGRGFKANGIDPRTGQQEAPTAILSKKREKWDDDKQFGFSINVPSYNDTKSMPLPQEMRGYEPAPAFPGRRASKFGDDYAAARRAHPQWRPSLAAGAPMPRRDMQPRR